jgi:hypothetical protein
LAELFSKSKIERKQAKNKSLIVECTRYLKINKLELINELVENLKKELNNYDKEFNCDVFKDSEQSINPFVKGVLEKFLSHIVQCSLDQGAIATDLGLRYQNGAGVGVVKDTQKALEYFCAAKDQNIIAQSSINLF